MPCHSTTKTWNPPTEFAAISDRHTSNDIRLKAFKYRTTKLCFFTSFGSSFMYHYHPCLVLAFHNSKEISIYTLDHRMVIKASFCGVSTEISTIYHHKANHFKINNALYMLKRVSHNASFWSPTPPCWIFEHQHFISIWETDIIIMRFDKTQPN